MAVGIISITGSEMRAANKRAKEGKPLHPCEKCGREMGAEFIFGPVCEKCVKKAHREVIGK